jgi:hypothetical protein
MAEDIIGLANAGLPEEDQCLYPSAEVKGTEGIGQVYRRIG